MSNTKPPRPPLVINADEHKLNPTVGHLRFSVSTVGDWPNLDEYQEMDLGEVHKWAERSYILDQYDEAVKAESECAQALAKATTKRLHLERRAREMR